MKEKPKYCEQCIFYNKLNLKKGKCTKLSYIVKPFEIPCDMGIKKEKN